jgi:hypothetical protein
MAQQRDSALTLRGNIARCSTAKTTVEPNCEFALATHELPVPPNGDRESGRFSRLPADRCALEVRSTTSNTYEFVALTAILRLQN